MEYWFNRTHVASVQALVRQEALVTVNSFSNRKFANLILLMLYLLSDFILTKS